MVKKHYIFLAIVLVQVYYLFPTVPMETYVPLLKEPEVI